MFINTVTEGVSDFPMMIFPVATIKVIHSHEVMWFKCIGKFFCYFKVPVGANFIGVVIIQFAVQICRAVIIMVIAITHRQVKPRSKFVVNIQINSTTRTDTLVIN